MNFLHFEHAVRDGLHTYTAVADSTLVCEVWSGLQDLAPYPDDDPELNPMERFCIGNFAGERLAVWRAVAWAVTDGLHRCGIPHFARDAGAAAVGIDRELAQLLRWEYKIDVEDGDLGFLPARTSVRIHPPPDQWEIDHGGFAGLFPLSSFDDLTGLDGAVFPDNCAQLTVWGLNGPHRFRELAAALNTPDRPVLADVLEPGDMFVTLATVRDSGWRTWSNSLTVKTSEETDAVDRVAEHYTAAYRRYLDRLDGLHTLADFRSAAEELLAMPGPGGVRRMMGR
jgi:hypothetical protein